MATSDERNVNYKYTPIFCSSRAECFLPFEEAIFDYKSHAKRYGSSQRDAVLASTGLRYSGKILRLTEGERRYPTIEIPVGDDVKAIIAVAGGPAYDEIMANPANAEKAESAST